MSRRRGRFPGRGAQLRYRHTRKRSYPTWSRAFWALISVKRHSRLVNYDGEPYWGRVYECRDTDTLGEIGPVHFHVGRPPRDDR